MIDWNELEEKWRQNWKDQKLFNSDPNFQDEKKYFITVAFPYPNSPQHIGHGRTYTIADVHARYMRMNGYQVLFPMGFHYTGTPILAMSKRVIANDKELIDTFHNVYGLSDRIIDDFKDPLKIATYFHKEIKLGMEEMGYSIDWRREFTTIDPLFMKFVTWQFNTLRKKGLIVQGSHPVGWCPNDNNPISQHDTLGDVEPEFIEYILIKFKMDDFIIPTATLRPETIFGVTNLWINPDIEYLHILIDDSENWIVSKEASQKLSYLNHKISVLNKIKGSELVNRMAINPINKELIPIYPASFVQPDHGTGIVMSVPAHAPYDYQALKDLQLSKKDDITKVVPVTIIESENFSIIQNDDSKQSRTIIPAFEIIKSFNIKNQSDPLLEKATAELYSIEFYRGRMLPNTGKYSGKPVKIAKDMVKNDLLTSKDNISAIMYELKNTGIKCRCGTDCVVKLLDNQWFINYGNADWKKSVHKFLDGKIKIIPSEIIQEFNYIVDWLKERACARKSGLGTKMPWDKEWIIESLSDSVIYMAYYIIAKYIHIKQEKNGTEKQNSDDVLAEENISDSFFDYIFLDIGDINEVSKQCNLSVSLIEQIKSEFQYFYPVDSRHSGRDLIPNHLSFFIFNHVAIFQEKYWPKQIVVNGSVLMDGKKMSKSLGNIIPLREAIKNYGADNIRLAILISAELLQDADFSFETVKGIRSKISEIYENALEYSYHYKSLRYDGDYFDFDGSQIPLNELEDRWIMSKLQKSIVDVTDSIDSLRLRDALHKILYAFNKDLQWYKKRAAAKLREDKINTIVAFYLSRQILMLSPFAPFISEELWEKYGHLKYVTKCQWPKVNHDLINLSAEESDNYLSKFNADLINIIKVTKIKPHKIYVYISSKWKQQLYEKIIYLMEIQNIKNYGEIMRKLINEYNMESAKKDPKLITKIIEDVLSEPVDSRLNRSKLNLAEFDEKFILNDGKQFLLNEIQTGIEYRGNIELVIYSEDDQNKYDPSSKSKFARPFKPAIYIE